MNAIRAAVSGSRVRYMKEGYDLDLTYITPSLIAMGYPACGMEKTYRNDISQVAAFLNSRHANSYRVYNLSERKYDYSKFENRVSECGFPDHHPPPLQALLDIMNDMLRFTAQSDENVVVVHCLAGKGRTGVVCSCFLLLTGFYGNIYSLTKDRELRQMANTAIRDFWNARGQGVRYPSQALYIYYFLRVVRRLNKIPRQIPKLRPAKKMLLTRVVLNGIPDYEAPPRGGCTPFLQILPAPAQHENPSLLYNSSWQNPNFETYAADPHGCIVFETNCIIQGDILLRCFHANSSSMLGRHVVQMFHVTFNTDFFHKKCDLYRLRKKEVDEAHDNARFSSTFCLDCHVEPIVDEEDEGQDQDEQDAHAMNPQKLHQLGGGLRESDASTVDSQSRSSLDAGRPSMQRASSSHQPKFTVAPTMMGWLYKQGGFVKSWKKRWFVAREGQLTYFAHASDPTPLGVVDLHGVHVDTAMAEETTAKNRYLSYFKIVPRRRDHRTWYFGADSEIEMAKWISVISAQACHGLGSGSIVPVLRRSSLTYQPSQPRNSSFNDQRLSESRARNTSASMIDFTTSSASNQADRGSIGAPGYAERNPQVTANAKPGQIARVNTGSSVTDAFATQSVETSTKTTGDLDEEDDEDDNFLRSSHVASAFTQSRPLDRGLVMSAKDRMTVLQQVSDDFQVGMYIYTADELHTAAKMQQYVTNFKMESRISGEKVSIAQCVKEALKKREYEYAEQLIAQVVMLEFPSLVDAMECNPAMFLDTICGQAIDSSNPSSQKSPTRSPSPKRKLGAFF